MADRVILVGARRGQERVSVFEIMQMIGRAGRKHGGGVCKAEVILDTKDFVGVVDEMEKGGKVVVKSSLHNARQVAFHLLPQVCDGGLSSIPEAEKWLSKTLTVFQGGSIDIEPVIALLEEAKALKRDGDKLSVTKLGRIAASLYFHAEDVKAWMDNFTDVFENGLDDDELSGAWALGNVPVSRNIGDFSDRWDIVSECKALVPGGLIIRDGSVINVVLWWCAMGGASAGKMRYKVIGMKDDFGRIKRALCEIDSYVTRWGKEEYFENLDIRVRRGIPMRLFKLCSMGLSKGLALYLYNMGVRDEVSLKECMDTMVLDIEDERSMDTLRGIVESI